MCNPAVRWEHVKSQVVKKCQEISLQKAKNINKRFTELQKRLRSLLENRDQMLNKCVSTANQIKFREEMEQVQNEINTHLEYKAKGARVRSKIQYYEDGEKSSKYFLGLEKVRYSNKTLNAIYCEDNTVTRDQRKNPSRTGKILL